MIIISKRSGSKKRRLSDKEIAERYKKGESTTVIAGEAGITPDAVRLVLKKMNVTLRPRGSWKRNYHVNEHYFKTWSNNMAYILGFFAADGFISDQQQMISFSQKEESILLKIREKLYSNHPILRNKNSGVYMLNINSKILKQDLLRLGMVPRKSMTLKFPEIHKAYLNHFVRGYFDGDGNINYKKRQVNIVGGSKEFMYSLRDCIAAHGIRCYAKPSDQYVRVIVSGRKSIFEFSEWIYSDHELCIQRKLDEFNQEKMDKTELVDVKHLKTKAAVKERKEKFLYELSKHASEKDVCEKLGILMNTYRTWLKKDPELSHAAEKLINHIKGD